MAPLVLYHWTQSFSSQKVRGGAAYRPRVVFSRGASGYMVGQFRQGNRRAALPPAQHLPRAGRDTEAESG